MRRSQFPKGLFPFRKHRAQKIYVLLGPEKLEEIFDFYCEKPELSVGAVAKAYGLSNLATVSCLMNYAVSNPQRAFQKLSITRYRFWKSLQKAFPDTFPEFCFYLLLQGAMARIFVGKRLLSLVDDFRTRGYITDEQWRFLILYIGQNLWYYYAKRDGVIGEEDGKKKWVWVRDKKRYNINGYVSDLKGDIYEPDQQKLANVLAPAVVTPKARLNLPFRLKPIRPVGGGAGEVEGEVED